MRGKYEKFIKSDTKFMELS